MLSSSNDKLQDNGAIQQRGLLLARPGIQANRPACDCTPHPIPRYANPTGLCTGCSVYMQRAAGSWGKSDTWDVDLAACPRHIPLVCTQLPLGRTAMNGHVEDWDDCPLTRHCLTRSQGAACLRHLMSLLILCQLRINIVSGCAATTSTSTRRQRYTASAALNHWPCTACMTCRPTCFNRCACSA